jgi:hypothetical protein
MSFASTNENAVGVAYDSKAQVLPIGVPNIRHDLLVVQEISCKRPIRDKDTGISMFSRLVRHAQRKMLGHTKKSCNDFKSLIQTKLIPLRVLKIMLNFCSSWFEKCPHSTRPACCLQMSESRAVTIQQAPYICGIIRLHRLRTHFHRKSVSNQSQRLANYWRVEKTHRVDGGGEAGENRYRSARS